MPDLLAHALVAYAVVTALSWRYDWLTPAYRTVGMAGAFIPDAMKIIHVLPDARLQAWLPVPFSWHAIHTTGGVVIAVLVGTVLVAASERRRVFGLLALGGASHLLADALLLTPSGRSYAVLWPVTRWHPPTPGLYLSTQAEPTIAAALVAGVVWAATRYRERHAA